MRMLLTSGGVHNDLIRQTLIDLLGKPIEEASIVAVIDAILPFPGDNTKTLADLQRLRDLGWKEYDLLSLFAGPASLIQSRLRSTDVIFCYGGSNHWLARLDLDRTRAGAGRTARREGVPRLERRIDDLLAFAGGIGRGVLRPG